MVAPSGGRPIPFNPARHPRPSPLSAAGRLASALRAPGAGSALRWLPLGLAGGLLLAALAFGLHLERRSAAPAPIGWGVLMTPACEWSSPLPFRGDCFGRRPAGFALRLLRREDGRWLVRDPLTANVAYVDLWSVQRDATWPGAAWATLHRPACEWSAPAAPARCFGRRAPGFSVRLLRPSGARLLIWDPRTRDVAYLDAEALGPAAP